MSQAHRILAIDDDPLDLSILEELLEEDYGVTAAVSGEEALEIVPRIHPDLILLDIMMPGIGGYETCRRLRESEKFRPGKSKILLVSSKATVSERLEGYEAGADDFIKKPFDHAELRAKVRVFLRLKSVEEVDQLKTEFMTLLSHETRTPLANMLGPAEILAVEGEMGESERRKLAEMIVAGGDRFRRLFDRAMILFSFRARDVEFNPHEIDVSTVIREIADSRAESASGKQIDLKVRCPESLEANLDLEHLRTLAQILLENAIEASPESKEVQLLLSENDEAFSVSVLDQREEADAKELSKVFQPYWVPDIIHHTTGCALDLPIVQEIARYYGGEATIEIQSGGGVMFQAVIPHARSRRSITDSGTLQDEEKATGTTGTI